MAQVLLTIILFYLIGCEIADKKAKQIPRKLSQYFVDVKTGDSRDWPI